ncbi:unnamed protein product [Dovyalis caffra]|uniref:Uncharacterized protein n=1 Tax=Dovyalis caffra TaxID=77055 RepID=A0AAV1RDV6_9ROSI|nr:unnamed protein product [Dovyalis caffra]
MSILHNIFIKGDQMSFELTAEDLEASKLYPDYKYTSVDSLLDMCLVSEQKSDLIGLASADMATNLLLDHVALPFPENILVSIPHNIFIKGDHMSFELIVEDLEASKLYPDYKYTSVDSLLDICLVNPPNCHQISSILMKRALLIERYVQWLKLKSKPITQQGSLDMARVDWAPTKPEQIKRPLQSSTIPKTYSLPLRGSSPLARTHLAVSILPFLCIRSNDV